MRRLLLGLMAGVTAGYTALRIVQSVQALQTPSAQLPKDAATYGALRRNLALAGTIRSLATSVAFAAGGAGPLIARGAKGAPVALRPPVFLLTGLILAAFVELPAAFVEEHEFERRFGLTEQPPRAWFTEHLKGTAIGAAVTAGLSIPFATLLRKKPATWPLLTFFGLVPLFVLAGLVVPVYIAPLFNTFEPLHGALEERLRRLAARYGAGGADILRVDMSRQTKKANAYVTGLFNTHRIVIADTLLETFKDEEIEFVVAHELGHYVSHDSWRMAAMGVGIAITMFGLSNAMMPAKKRRSYDDPAVLYELYVWMLIFSAALRPPIFAFSRSREWAADRFAVDATQLPAIGAAAFRRLRDQNLAEEEVPRWYELLFSSHPSLGARIAALESAAN
ncbi:MAG: M48 family metalloprotease [Candidatus Eremiobacteraeota bacterium]|nr:M48 family metalloprotease [Candidatus Eremiobacteraeota bacterium]